ncbi:hypothetical protein AB7M37_006440 [Sinorhizobium fredii]
MMRRQGAPDDPIASGGQVCPSPRISAFGGRGAAKEREGGRGLGLVGLEGAPGEAGSLLALNGVPMHVISSAAATKAATPLFSTGRASRPAARRVVGHRCRRRYDAAPCPGDERPRIVLTGYSDGMRDWLRSLGLLCETISWKLRFFVLTTEAGPAILSQLMQRHRMLDVVSWS